MRRFSKIIYLLLVIAGIAVLLPVSPAQENSMWTKPLKQCWVYQTDKMSSLKIASDNDRTIILPILGGNVEGIEASSGSNLWRSNIGRDFDSELFVNETNVYVAGTQKTEEDVENSTSLLSKPTSESVFSININSGIGSVISEKKSSKEDAENGFVLSYRSSLLALEKNGQVKAVDKSSKQTLWEKDLKTMITAAPVIFNDGIFIGTANKTVVLLSPASGRIISQIPVGKTPSILFPTDQTIFIGDQEGNFYSISADDKNENWQTKTGGKIVKVLDYKDTLLVSSNDNFVYAIHKKSGKKVWKRKLAGRILGKTVLDEKVGVFLTYGSDTAVFLDMSEGNVVNRIELPEKQYFVSAPLSVRDILVLPTNIGLYAYSAGECGNRVTS